jgi:hypothetical protein
MKERKIIFHATSPENLESILNCNCIKPSRGRYGTGVYCRQSFVDSVNYNDCVFGIYLRGLEDKAAIPGNKLGKWIVFKDKVPMDHIKYIIRFKPEEEPNESILKEDKNGILFYEVPFSNEVDKQEKVVDVSNDIFQHADESLIYPPRYDRIKVCRNYSLE